MLEFISEKEYKLNISSLSLYCKTDTPITTTVLQGIIEWYRKQTCAIYFNNSNGSYVFILTYSRAYLMQEGEWQRFLSMSRSPEELVRELTKDISERISDWCGVEYKSKKDAEQELSSTRKYLDLIDGYSKAMHSEYMDFTGFAKAEEAYADYIKSNPYMK
jgi:hypothetical protein